MKKKTGNRDKGITVKATVYDKKGNILSVGYNSYIKTHPYQAALAKKHGKEEQIYLHAEIAALVKVRGEPYEIYVERYYRNGEAALAKPCPICQRAIEEAGVKVVKHT